MFTFSRRLALVLVLGLLTAGCGDSPTNPSPPNNPPPPSSQTRIIELEGNLDFGDVKAGSPANRTIRVLNRGNAPLTVTGIGWPGTPGQTLTANWTSGTIQPNQWQDVVVTFNPSGFISYSGNVTIQANQTSGTNTMPLVARGFRDLFTRSGVGNAVFDMPSDMTRVRIRANPNSSCQNFVVVIGGSLIINDILGTCSVADARTYDGTHSVGSLTKQVEIRISTGVSWTFDEIR